MGLCRKLFRSIIVSTLIVLAIILLPNIPPYVEYTAFQVPPSRRLEGKLAVNHLLNNPDKLFVGDIKGPEAFTVLDGDLLTTVHGGYVVRVYDDQIVPVVKFGQPCDGWWEEKKCGRPLGIAAAGNGHIVVADAYYGIFKHHVETGRTTQLVSPNDIVGDRKPKLFNGLDVAKDGSIYWTDSSSDFELQDGLFAFLADPSGRLIRYDPKTKKNEVLIDKLHFPNGVVVSHEDDFVLVAETARNTIHRYYLAGPKRGTHDVFVNDLPGLPDNLRRNNKQGFIVTLVLAKDPDTPVLAHAINPFPNIRKFFARTLALLELGFGHIHSIYPSYYTARAIHFIGHFEMTKSLSPLRSTVLELSSNGEYVESYHSTDGGVSGISDAIVHNGYLYLGSPYAPYLARVKSSKLMAKLSGPGPTITTSAPTTTARPTTTTTTPRPTTTTTPRPTTTTTSRPTTTTTPRPTTTTTPRPATTTTTTTPRPVTTTTPRPATTTTTPPPATTTTTPRPATTTTTPRPATTTTTPRPATTTTTPRPATTTTTPRPATTTPRPATTTSTTPKPKTTPEPPKQRPSSAEAPKQQGQQPKS